MRVEPGLPVVPASQGVREARAEGRPVQVPQAQVLQMLQAQAVQAQAVQAQAVQGRDQA
jgi:hypothetical protein